MKTIQIADMTMRASTQNGGFSLSFKEKLDVARELDRLCVDVIETVPIVSEKPDSLLIKTISSIVTNSTVSVPVGYTAEAVDVAWAAVSVAKKPRLLVNVPVSPVQMEYVCHMKPSSVIEMISEVVAKCKSYCADVEFSAEDATRAEKGFLYQAIDAAIRSGAGTVTICDSAGVMLPEEFTGFIGEICQAVPAMKDVAISIECSDELGMASASAFSAISAGARQIKTTVNGAGVPSMEAIAAVFRSRGDDLGVRCTLDMTGLNRAIRRMNWLASTQRSETSAFDNIIPSESDVELDSSADIETLENELRRMGYELSDEDMAKVFEAFGRVAAKKTVSSKELDAIVAAAALQVPPTYKIISYVVNCGNIINATAMIKLEKDGETIQGLMTGDGPIDSSFLAIEQIIGHHYELEDFQVAAVTEGREAMGSAVVKLRQGGKLFSGKAVSTDIVGASIRAYVDAINKIVYEENY